MSPLARGFFRWASALCLAALVVFSARGVAAQGQVGPENVYLQPGQPGMDIYILGDVARPGKWRVTTGAELFDVLAVAVPAGTGGAGGASSRVDVELYRSSGSTRRLVYEGSLDPLITSSEATMSLEAGDVIQVKAIISRPLRLVEVVQVVTGVASLILLVVNLASGS